MARIVQVLLEPRLQQRTRALGLRGLGLKLYRALGLLGLCGLGLQGFRVWGFRVGGFRAIGSRTLAFEL